MVCASVVIALLATDHAAADQTPPAKRDRSGEEIFRWACAACHGADGSGAALSQVGFDDPLPDFTDCSFATPEHAADWLAVMHDGGPARAFDRRMPAFGEALTEPRAGADPRPYARGFCTDPPGRAGN